jgi:TetR/AcrR family transcriptional regulator, cholesterol catabolism regulator
METKSEEILRIGANLIARKGYGETSFQEIADRVKLHKSSIFHYFSSKEELLLRILEKPIQEVGAGLEKIVKNKALEPEEKLKRAIDNQIGVMAAHRDTVTIFLNEVRNLSKKNRTVYVQERKQYQKEFLKIIVEMQAKGHFNGLDPTIVTLAILGMLNWVVRWHKKNGPSGLDEISNVFYRMMVPADTGPNRQKR